MPALLASRHLDMSTVIQERSHQLKSLYKLLQRERGRPYFPTAIVGCHSIGIQSSMVW